MKKPWYIKWTVILFFIASTIIGILGADRWYGKVLFCLLFGGAIAVNISTADKRERGQTFNVKRPSRFAPYIQPWGLPLFVALCLVIFLPSIGLSATIDELFPRFALLFLHISIYSGILLLLLPLMRRHFSARVCAALWILPNILYIAYNRAIKTEQPLLIIPLNISLGYWPVLIWSVGFWGILLYQIINHLLFKRKLLINAKRVWDVDIQRIWYDVLEEGHFKIKTYPLMTSSAINAPLSIGFFPKTTYVILPQREYTEDELRLILRHEAVHIGRQDSFTKFFMVFCAAVCWFNPLAWIAVRHCSADMELSCDETVLLGEGEKTRQCYAELLLKTAGDDRGFSTCLSASAKTMLYRLTHVLKPQKRFLGAIAAGFALFLLLSTCGMVAIAYRPILGDECIFNTTENASWSNGVIYKANDQRSEYEYADITFLHQYVSGITFYQLTGAYTYPNDDTLISFYYQKKDYKNDYAATGVISNGVVEFMLEDHTLTIIDYATGGLPEVKTYYHNKDIDWEYLISKATPVS